jgi:hypothetical protein
MERLAPSAALLGGELGRPRRRGGLVLSPRDRRRDAGVRRVRPSREAAPRGRMPEDTPPRSCLRRRTPETIRPSRALNVWRSMRAPFAPTPPPRIGRRALVPPPCNSSSRRSETDPPISPGGLPVGAGRDSSREMLGIDQFYVIRHTVLVGGRSIRRAVLRPLGAARRAPRTHRGRARRRGVWPVEVLMLSARGYGGRPRCCHRRRISVTACLCQLSSNNNEVWCWNTSGWGMYPSAATHGPRINVGRALTGAVGRWRTPPLRLRYARAGFRLRAPMRREPRHRGRPRCLVRLHSCPSLRRRACLWRAMNAATEPLPETHTGSSAMPSPGAKVRTRMRTGPASPRSANTVRPAARSALDSRASSRARRRSSHRRARPDLLQLRLGRPHLGLVLVDDQLEGHRIDRRADVSNLDLGVEVAPERPHRARHVGADLHRHQRIQRAGGADAALDVAPGHRGRDVLGLLAPPPPTQGSGDVLRSCPSATTWIVPAASPTEQA